MGSLFTDRSNKNGISCLKFSILMNFMNSVTWSKFDFEEEAKMFEINTTFLTFIIGISGDTLYLCAIDEKPKAETVPVIICLDLNKMKITSKFIIQEEVESVEQMQIVGNFCLIRKYMRVFPSSETLCVYDLENWNRIAVLKIKNKLRMKPTSEILPHMEFHLL